MNCHSIKNQLDDYLDCTLSSKERSVFESHIEACSACAEMLAEAKSFQQVLKTLPVPPMRLGLAQQAIAAAAKREGQHRRGFVAGFSSALAASFVFFVIFFGFDSNVTAPTSAALPEIEISLNQPQTVNLVFDVAIAMENATLTIALPDDVEVLGFPSQQQISWQTNLEKGRNILPLPLTGYTQKGGILVAKIVLGDKQKSISVKIRVKDQSVTQTPITAERFVRSLYGFKVAANV